MILPLSNGFIAFVDNDVYENVKHLNWYADKVGNIIYVANHSTKVKVYLHHVVMGKPTKSMIVDHIDGNGLNNQRDNLRIVTKRKNLQNMHMHRKGRLVGANFVKDHFRTKPWESKIYINGKSKRLGFFVTELEAHNAYEKAVSELK